MLPSPSPHFISTSSRKSRSFVHSFRKTHSYCYIRSIRSLRFAHSFSLISQNSFVLLHSFTIIAPLLEDVEKNEVREMSAFTNYCVINSDIESENKKIDLKK